MVPECSGKLKVRASGIVETPSLRLLKLLLILLMGLVLRLFPVGGTVKSFWPMPQCGLVPRMPRDAPPLGGVVRC